MDHPLAVLRTCLDDLLKQLGVDPAVERSLSRQLKPIDEMAWLGRTQEDLPTEVLQVGGRGHAHLRLIVGPEGKPIRCAALGSSGASMFGNYACKMAMKYARFQPALDANSKPVTAIFAATVSYKLTDAEPPRQNPS
jgi:protein TonB